MLIIFISTVPKGVKLLNVQPINHDKLKVSWKTPKVTPKVNPCPATDYQVTYDLINLEQCQEVKQYGGSRYTNKTTIILDELKAYSTYRVNVTSINKDGNSPEKSYEMTTGETSKLVYSLTLKCMV